MINQDWLTHCGLGMPYVGMPLLTRCHWQCLDRLSQIFATLCKVCFYGWFSIENEVNAGNFCPGLIHWALLSVQFGCFGKKIEYFRKIGKFEVLFDFQNTFSTKLHTWGRHRVNDKLIILVFALKYCMKLSVFGCIQWKNKTKFWMIKVIFTSGGRFSCLIVVTFQLV